MSHDEFRDIPDGTERIPLPRGTYAPIVESILRYVRLQCFVGPEQIKRYYRLFGDLEYDRLALRAETAVMRLRLREVRRRLASNRTISPEEEREICVTSHEMTEHLYRQTELKQASIARSRNFRYDREREQQGCLLFADIAAAIVGIADPALRARELDALTAAIDAYGRLDVATLIDLHDRVQQFVGLQRRERLDEHEECEWHQKLAVLSSRHPLARAADLDDPKRISARMAQLKRRIDREQKELEHLAMVYLAAVRASRYTS
jgi:hypothetical protein